jgi:hypothetical protein
MDNIQEFNTNLAEKLIKYDLNVYFNTVHSKYYKNVDISFMDYFLSLISKKGEFCVDHIKLQEYNVLNNIETSSKILRSLEQFNLEENVDYLLSNVGQQLLSGTKYSKEYKLTPNAFKLCLIRAKNSKVYAKYYLMLEEIFYYYREYQNQYQIVLLSMKDDKIDEQSRKIDNLQKDINDLLGYARDTKEKLDETNEELNDINDKFDDLNDKVDDMKEAFEETAGRSVPEPTNDENKSEFVLLQSKILPNEFTFMRGIQSYNDIKLNNKYAGDYNIIKREFNANPIQLYRLFRDIVKEEIKKNKKIITDNKNLKNKNLLKKQCEIIKFNGNKIILIHITQNELLDKIKDISEMKYKEYKNTTEDIP